jgi:hypothetical protein
MVLSVSRTSENGSVIMCAEQKHLFFNKPFIFLTTGQCTQYIDNFNVGCFCLRFDEYLETS